MKRLVIGLMVAGTFASSAAVLLVADSRPVAAPVAVAGPFRASLPTPGVQDRHEHGLRVSRSRQIATPKPTRSPHVHRFIPAKPVSKPPSAHLRANYPALQYGIA